MKCPQCQSPDLISDVRVIDRGEDNAKYGLELELPVRPGVTIGEIKTAVPVSAKVCPSCGFVSLFLPPNERALFQDAEEIKRALKRPEPLKNHARFKEFLKADPLHKHLNPDDQVRRFARWLREQEEDP